MESIVCCTAIITQAFLSFSESASSDTIPLCMWLYRRFLAAWYYAQHIICCFENWKNTSHTSCLKLWAAFIPERKGIASTPSRLLLLPLQFYLGLTGLQILRNWTNNGASRREKCVQTLWLIFDIAEVSLAVLWPNSWIDHGVSITRRIADRRQSVPTPEAMCG